MRIVLHEVHRVVRTEAGVVIPLLLVKAENLEVNLVNIPRDSEHNLV
ncbi:hypothetical protein ES703_99346 [subsurface metagenome]